MIAQVFHTETILSSCILTAVPSFCLFFYTALACVSSLYHLLTPLLTDLYCANVIICYLKLSLISKIAAEEEGFAPRTLRQLLLAAFSVYFKGLASCRFLYLRVTDDRRLVASVETDNTRILAPIGTPIRPGLSPSLRLCLFPFVF